MTTCEHCGLPKLSADGRWTGEPNYIGPACAGCTPSKLPIFSPRLSTPANKPEPLVVEGCQAYNPLTESDIRRIIREELLRLNTVKDKSHD